MTKHLKEAKMKKSKVFWTTVGVIAVICYNIFWYNYELKYANDLCQMCDESGHTVMVGMYGVVVDFWALVFCLIIFVPRFNKWIDSL